MPGRVRSTHQGYEGSLPWLRRRHVGSFTVCAGPRLSLRRFDGAQGNPLDFLTVSGVHSTVTSSLTARDAPHGTARNRTSEEDTAQRPAPCAGRQNGVVWRLGYA